MDAAEAQGAPRVVADAHGCEVVHGDCRVALDAYPDNHFDSCVCDPPYHLTSIVKRFGKDGAAPAKSEGAGGAYARLSTGFMGAKWDGGDVAFDPATWRHVYRVLKPGAHLVAFGGTRTWHRLACAIEDAGFELRDTCCWLYGSGFPKSLDVAKGIDKEANAERSVVGWRKVGRGLAFSSDGPGSLPITEPATAAPQQWQGWGSALKPAFEPVLLARKPLSEPNIAANVLRWGTGALNVDGCRIGTGTTGWGTAPAGGNTWNAKNCGLTKGGLPRPVVGRWPANVLLDEAAAALLDEQVGTLRSGSGAVKRATGAGFQGNAYGAESRPVGTPMLSYGDSGGPSRFYYVSKASRAERDAGLNALPEQVVDVQARHHSRRMETVERFDGAEPAVGRNPHPTVKPLDLLRYLIRLVTPPGGLVLDPFAGSGSTGCAAALEGMRSVLIELGDEPVYLDVIVGRVAHWAAVAERERGQGQQLALDFGADVGGRA